MTVAPDPLRYFRIEARELVDQLESGVLALASGDAKLPDAVAALLRATHTLKGAARVVRQTEIAERSHALEGALWPLRTQTEGRLDPASADALLAALDGLRGATAALTGGPTPVSAPEPAPAAPVPQEPSVDASDVDALLAGLDACALELAAVQAASSVPRAGDHDRLGHAVVRLGRELVSVRNAAERLRLVSVQKLAPLLQRLVWDAARSDGKLARLEANLPDVRLETEAFQQVQVALVQIVRNAVAHGLETRDERRRANKPEHGRIDVSVSLQGSSVVFSCRDDGRGIDVPALRRAAIQQGLSFDEAADDDAVLAEILALRTSTAAEVTEQSGRGVGLDVVRAAAARLGGSVTVTSQRGVGAGFDLLVPLARAALQVLVIEAGGQRFSIPLASVHTILRVDASASEVHDPGAEDPTHAPVPVVALSDLVGGLAAWSDEGRQTTLLLRTQDGAIAVSIERVVDVARPLIRALPSFVPASRLLAGAWTDAGGTVHLVLDPAQLVRHGLAALRRVPPRTAARMRPLPVLVVDDSLTTRMLEQSILETAGYQVEVAGSAEEALDKVQQRAYGLLLLDVEMTGMDGFAFLERARNEPTLGGVPIILVSSRSSVEDRQRGQSLGAADYVVKGEFDQRRLLSTVARLVRAA